jgi:RND family efflux transporter MFP subunit
MRFLRVLLVVVLLAVGVGAIAVVAGVVPTSGTNAASQYLTATVTRRDVTESAAADGNAAATATYSLSFGVAPQPATSSSSSSSSSNNSSSNGNSTATVWPVTAVSATVGASVQAGDVLATADPASANLALQEAQANLDAAKARLSTDKSGPNGTDRAAAHDSVTQAQTQLAQAEQSAADTRRQNNISISQARSAVSSAEAQLSADKKSGAPAATISADQRAVTSAKQNLTSTEARATASNHQAQNQITNASHGVTSAKHNYSKAVAPADSAQIASDEAAVASAETSLANAKLAVQYATITAPVAGTVTAVNVAVGTNAPSGAAISLASAQLQVSADFTETDLPSLKIGQAAAVTVKAVGSTPIAGTVTAIAAQPASTSGGVVSYAVTVGLTNPPAAMRTGMSASVTVTLAQSQNALAVPTSALEGATGDYTVLVLGDGGQATPTAVQVGLVTNTYAEITSGLSQGQEVVTGTTAQRNSTSNSTTGFPGIGGGGAGRFVGGGGGGGNFRGGGTGGGGTGGGATNP